MDTLYLGGHLLSRTKVRWGEASISRTSRAVLLVCGFSRRGGGQLRLVRALWWREAAISSAGFGIDGSSYGGVSLYE